MSDANQTELLQSAKTVKPKRMQWLDYDKGITILLVGYGHCLSTLTGTVPDLDQHPVFTYIGTFLYGFRMPLFFIVSGILISGNLRKKGLKKYIITRADLLYAMMVWGIIEITLKLLAHSDTASYWSYLYLLIDPRQTGHFWYLNALFCIGTLYAILTEKGKLKPLHHLLIGLVAYALSSYALLQNMDAGFLTEMGRYYIFFAIGNAASAWLLDEKRQQSLATWKLFVPLILVFAGLQYYCTGINLQHAEYGNRFVETKMPVLYLLEAIVGCATSMSLSFLLQKHKVFKWITTIGSYSLFIYLMQIIIMSFSRSLLVKMLHPATPALILSIWAIGTLLPIFLYKLFMRTGFWWLFSFHKPPVPIKVKVIQVPSAIKSFIGKRAE